MASGKNQKNVPTKTIKNYRRFEDSSQPQGKYESRNSPPRYKMPPRTRQQISALLAAGFLTAGIISANFFKASSQETIAHATKEIPSATIASVQENKPEAHTLEFFEAEPETIYTISIANYDAEITVDGKSYPIGNSFVISSGTEAVASDVHGNFLKGQLTKGTFKTVTQKTESEMANYNYFQVVSKSPANVRSSGEIADGNVISSVPSGDYVLASKQNTPEYDGEWLSTLTINDGHLYEGYMREDVLQEIGTIEAVEYRTDKSMENIENLAMVDTSRDEYISLNMRAEPGKDVVAKIPYGSFVEILGKTMQYGNKSWNLVNYQSPDGKQVQGWVASQYLTQEVVKEKPGPKVIDGIHVNSSGTVTGIDVSTLSPDALRTVLENGISDTSRSVHGDFDTSQISGKVNYVYIKLGASSYGKGDFKILNYDKYIEQVAICEEMGIPYGFYYYSTAINKEEAIMELDCIKDRVEDLRQRYDMNNNLLEIAVDVELTNTQDRQYRGNIKEQTEAKALLINGIQELNLSDNVLIYGPGRVMQPDLDQIFDLEYLNSLLSSPENVSLWQCSLMNSKGETKADLRDDMAYGEKCGFSTTTCQSGLDFFVESNGKSVGLIDINQMDFEHFRKLKNPEQTQAQEQENKVFTLDFFAKESKQEEKTTYSLSDDLRYDDGLEI